MARLGLCDGDRTRQYSRPDQLLRMAMLDPGMKICTMASMEDFIVAGGG